MLTIGLNGPREAAMFDAVVPEVLPGTILVSVSYCGIGGSDMEAWAAGSVQHPAWFGHEWSGKVIDIGEGVEDHFEGERVVGAVGTPCGTCRPCSAGLGSHCATALRQIVGADEMASPHGAFAETIRVDARRALRIPDGVEDRLAAVAEPAAAALHAIDRAKPRLGDTVVVVGAGTIGLLVAELSRLAGAAAVVAVDPEPRRGELACDLGANAAFADTNEDLERWISGHGHGLGADVVFVCVESTTALSSALQFARSGGTVVGVGVGDRSGSLSSSPLIERELTLRTSLGYTRTDARRALDLIALDRLRVRPLITEGSVPLEQLPDAFRILAEERPTKPKTLVQPSAS